ncbi:MAG: hypothetical protein ACE37H_08320 [Phycisphaeraceae bacterium]
MTLVGRLSGEVDGRPIAIHADDGALNVHPASLRAAWAMRRSYPQLCQSLRKLGTLGVSRVQVKLAPLGTHRLYPDPPFWLRLFLPR